MPRRPAIHTQADLARAVRAAASTSPPGVVRVLADGSLLMIPGALVADSLSPAATARQAAQVEGAGALA